MGFGTIVYWVIWKIPLDIEVKNVQKWETSLLKPTFQYSMCEAKIQVSKNFPYSQYVVELPRRYDTRRDKN